jgi:hypothetical protein
VLEVVAFGGAEDGFVEVLDESERDATVGPRRRGHAGL